MAGKTKRIVAPSLAMMMLALMLGAFQNCTVPAQFGEAGNTQKPQVGGDGNGTGYEGKPYANPDIAKECTDGDSAKSRIIETKSGELYLTRANCAPVAPAKKISQDFVHYDEGLDHSVSVYVFQNRLFQAEPTRADGDGQSPNGGAGGPSSPTLPAFSGPLYAFCKAQKQGVVYADIKIVKSAGDANAYAARVTSKYVSEVKLSSEISGSYKCGEGKSYVSSVIPGRGYFHLGQAVFMMQTSGASAGAPSLAISPTNPDALMQGVLVRVSTNFLQDLLLTNGATDSENACISRFTDSVTPNQGAPLTGNCFLANPPMALNVDFESGS